jgi:hypothetical protein
MKKRGFGGNAFTVNEALAQSALVFALDRSHRIDPYLFFYSIDEVRASGVLNELECSELSQMLSRDINENQ